MTDLNAQVVQGDTVVLTITAKNKYTGNAVSIAGASIIVSFTKKVGATPDLTKTTSSGISITDGANGVMQVTLSKTDTAAMEGKYFYEIQVTDASSSVSTFRNEDLSAGVLTVLKDIIA
jgi:hypothetical protein